jgi:hypothetical protein
MTKPKYDQPWYESLTDRYKPLLVLYPEIPKGSVRKEIPDWKTKGCPPLTHDYHPRDIKLVLENAAILGDRNGEPGNFEDMLKLMEANRRSRIDIVVGAGPNDKDAFWNRYAANKDKYDRRCYANVVRGRGRYKGLLALEYWYAYFYNDWKFCHEMDWEEVVVYLKVSRTKEDIPVACACSAHGGGYRLRWNRVGKANDQQNRDENGTHPIIYVGQGSHANYFFGGRTYPTTSDLFKKFPGGRLFQDMFLDFVASLEEVDPQMIQAQLVPPPTGKQWPGEWQWLNFKGKWGSPGPSDAPAALTTRRYQWANPFLWVDEKCLDDPDHPTWLLR